MHIHENILSTIGHTPLVKLNRVTSGIEATVCAKLEAFNPMGSVKDRPALAMIERAEAEGLLQPGATIVEPTSGNTGLGIAMVAATRGYRVVLVMGEAALKTTIPKAARALGAEVIFTKLFSDAVVKAHELQHEWENVFIPNQFENPSNPGSHVSTTQEIIDDAGAGLKAFVASFGSSGTLTGVGRRLKKHKADIEIAVAEPENIPHFSGGEIGCSGIPGIGPPFRPAIMEDAVVDTICKVTNAEANEMTDRLAREEGIFCGPSSGVICCAALRVAKNYKKGDVIVSIFPDTGNRYLTEVQDDSYKTAFE